MAQFYRVAYLGQGLNVRDEGPSCDVCITQRPYLLRFYTD